MKEVYKIFQNYSKLIKKDKRKLRPYYFWYFLMVLFELILPIYVAKITENITYTRYEKAFMCVFIYLGLKIGMSLLSTLIMRSYSNFFKNNYINLYQKIVHKIYTLTEKEKKKIKIGQMMNNLTLDIITVGEMADIFLTLLLYSLKIIVIFLYFFKWQFFLTFFLMTTEILYILLSLHFSNQATFWAKKQRNTNEKGINLINETLLGLKDIQTLDFSENYNKKFEKVYIIWQKMYDNKRKYQIKRKIVLKIGVSIIKVFLYCVGIIGIVKKKIGLEQLLIMIAYFDSLFASTETVMTSVEQIKEQNIAINRLQDLVKIKRKKNVALKKVKGKLGKIEFKNVSFSYNHEKLLTNLNFTIKPNKINVIIGNNGSGKTTLLNLIMRIYEPKKGNIFLDGLDITKIEKNSYLNEITILNQESYLFNRSIRENFNLINKDFIKQKEICSLLGIDDFIEKLPKGYDTLIDEKSNNLSRGQKRLIALARTLLKDTKILILDEVEASLDDETVKRIKKNLPKLKENHTILIISHKKEIQKLADKIIRLNKGTVKQYKKN